MRLLIALALAAAPALPTSAATAANYWHYDDWHVSVDRVDTGEDLRTTCYAHTGGDGDPVWALEVSNGDAGPPDYFPAPRLIEIAPGHHLTAMHDLQSIEFEFDSGSSVHGDVIAYINDEGLYQAESSPAHNSVLTMLISMRHGSTVDARADGQVIATASLKGFTAAYGKMMDECGFTLALN